MLPTTPIPIDAHTVNTNKENVIIVNPLRNVNGRRTRSKPANSPSHVYIARQAARDPRRRRTLSPPLIAQKRSIRIPVDDDMDVDMVDFNSPSAAEGAQRVAQLPRRLKRPVFKDISAEALQAVDPNLEQVALEYIHGMLQSVGAELLATASSTTASPPQSHLPRELQVLIQDMSASLPTHLFAIYSKTSPRVTLHPAHALVLAANCAHLPALPPSKATSHAEVSNSTTTTITLPVVPLCLPNPASFPTLLHYLYTKRPEQLFAWFLPPTAGTPQSLTQLSQHLAATFKVEALLAHAARVHGLWTNVVALGVFDDTLWKAMEMAWEVLLGALANTSGAQWHTQTQKQTQT